MASEDSPTVSRVHHPPHGTVSRAFLLDRWELTSRVSEGQWSVVYRARPRGSSPERQADYAVKVARTWETAHAGQAETLLRREAVVAHSVAHPHIVSVLAEKVDAAPCYLVMPMLRGASLRAILDAHSPLDTPHALWIARQVAEALATLHDAGWMHADVKPCNIFVSPEGHATLIDLGFALRLGSSECAVGGTLRGTLAYTAPEMFSSAMPIDEQSDVYSLGVTLYEMLTGQPPFTDSDPGQLALAHMQRPAPNPRRTCPTLWNGAVRTLSTMLAKQPLRRPNARELIRQLADLEITTLEERCGV